MIAADQVDTMGGDSFLQKCLDKAKAFAGGKRKGVGGTGPTPEHAKSARAFLELQTTPPWRPLASPATTEKAEPQAKSGGGR